MRKNRSKLYLFLIILFIAIFAAVGCSSDAVEEEVSAEESKDGEKTETEDSGSGGTMNVAFYQQPPTLDIHMTTSAASYMVGRHMFESLMALTSDYESVPMLAESVDESDDGLTYTFTLREGVQFHNGNEMIAEDVVASMERWRELNASSELVFGGSTWEEDGDYTVVLTLEDPATGVLESLAAVLQAPVIMPKEVLEDADVTGIDEFIGTGPFQFEEWTQDKHIRLKKFDAYQAVDMEADGFAGKKEALVDEINFEIVLDASTRLAGITSGQYDAAYALSNDDYSQLQSDENIETYEAPSGTAYLIFNKKDPSHFTDPKMRQAVNMALNIDDIMLGGFANEALYDLDHGFMTQYAKTWYSESGSESFNQNDLEKAKELLDEAGYDGEEVVLLTDRTHPTIYGMAVVIQEQLAEIGIPATLDSYDWATVSERRTDPENWDFYINNLPEVVIPSQILPLSASWPGWADDDKFVELQEDIVSAPSQEDAQEVWSDLQKYAWEEYMPAVKFGNYYSLDVATDNLEGVTSFHNLILWNTKKTD